MQSSSDRDALLGGGVRGGGGGVGGAGGEVAVERANPEQLLMRTQNEMKTQDDILDSMSKGLDGLKTIGIAIRDETDLHMKLLDDLDGTVDKGAAALKRETARADWVAADTKSCWLYVTICLLFIVLISLVSGRRVSLAMPKPHLTPSPNSPASAYRLLSYGNKSSIFRQFIFSPAIKIYLTVLRFKFRHGLHLTIV